jgi:hypothetical protein
VRRQGYIHMCACSVTPRRPRPHALTPLLASPQSCCEPEPHAAAPSQLFCFASSTGAEKRCLDPIPILTVRGARRCDSEIDCSDASCVRLDTSAHLLRITVVSADKIEQVILWSGPPEEVYEQGLFASSLGFYISATNEHLQLKWARFLRAIAFCRYGYIYPRSFCGSAFFFLWTLSTRFAIDTTTAGT